MDDITSLYNESKTFDNINEKAFKRFNTDESQPDDETFKEKLFKENIINEDVYDKVEFDKVEFNKTELNENNIKETEFSKLKVDIIDNEDNYPDDTVFKTQQVASFFGTNPQQIRNYAKAYGDVLEVRKTETGDEKHRARIWTKKDVKQLRSILELKKRNGWTDGEVVSRLTEPSGALMQASISDKALESLSKYLTADIAEKVKSAMMGVMAEQLKYLSDNSASITSELEKKIDYLVEDNAATKKQYSEKTDLLLAETNELKTILKDINNVNEAKIQEQKEEYEKKIADLIHESEKKENNYQESNKQLENQLDRLTQKLEELEKKQSSIEETNARLHEQMENSTKKKSFWPFGRK